MDNLLRQGFDAFCPRYVLPVDAHRFRPPLHLLFPGYVFVLIHPDTRWRSINGTSGVVRLMTTGADDPRPMVIRDEEMARVRAHLPTPRRWAEKPPPSLDVDTVVRVRHPGSPFFERIGTVTGMTKRQRVRVLMALLGRDTEVVFDYDDLDVVTAPEYA